MKMTPEIARQISSGELRFVDGRLLPGTGGGVDCGDGYTRTTHVDEYSNTKIYEFQKIPGSARRWFDPWRGTSFLQEKINNQMKGCDGIVNQQEMK